jgi:glucose-6-phosphate isomerase
LTYLFDAPSDPAPMGRAEFRAMAGEALAANKRLAAGEGDLRDGGVPMLGWLDLPVRVPPAHLDAVTAAARELGDRVDAFVSLGIGGSYLGIEASLRFLTPASANALSREARGGRPEIHFLGQHLDPDLFCDTLAALAGKRVAVSVISKSGTTTETAIAFRVLRALLERALGEEARDVIVATTDPTRGALRSLAAKNGYRTFEVPDDVGGRFSVLTDVGLLGIAMAGIDLHELIAGAADMRERCLAADFAANPALAHAAARVLAWRKGKKIEVVATNADALLLVAKWMEQLFPESEGKGGVGLWVSPSMYSEKLHANGQMIQDGERNLIETFLKLERHDSSVAIPVDPADLDGLNYLPASGKDMNAINALVVDGPAYAHWRGGVPNMTVLVPDRSAYVLGQLYYLFERSVAVSGLLLGVNPFVQPGVEAYKKAMFALAGKPGSEGEGERIRAEVSAIPRVTVR